MRSGCRRGAVAVTVAAACVLLSGVAMAFESIEFLVGQIDGGPWSATGVVVEVVVGTSDPIDVTVSIDAVELPAPLGAVGRIELRCPDLQVGADDLRCARAEARVAGSLLDDKPFALAFSYRPETGAVRVHSEDIPLLGRRAALDGAFHSGGWSATLRARELDAAVLHERLAATVAGLDDADVTAGSVNVDAGLAAGTAGPTIRAQLAVQGLAVSNEAGTLATDNLAARVELELDRNRAFGDYDYRLAIAADDGEAYYEPMYFDFSAPLAISAHGWLNPETKKLVVSDLSYDHAGTLEARVRARLSQTDRMTVEFASVKIGKMTFPAAYQTYVQGFLVGTPLARLQTGGTMRGSVELSANRPRAVDLVIDNFDADDTGQRLAIYGVRGDLYWRGGETLTTPESLIEWNGGFIHSIGYGPASMTLTLGGDDIKLDGAVRVPVLDGALVIDEFSARGLTGDRPELDLNARLEPIGLRRLGSVLNWPPFPGKLSGELERLSLRDGVIAVGGDLSARVFDGTVGISGLRIERPFSANARGFATIVLDNLDLGLLTEVFSVGSISGRLDGRINDLQTVKNQPVGFDARFSTPPDDDSPHRISRRAIDNLSEIGGGGPALLPAAGFLRFFEDFGYTRLGIGCRLVGDICQMSGVRPAANGFYIVQGRGLPRIDVIGHSREVNWRRLIAQIQQALESGDATTVKPSESPP